jgi:hypothetical protein
MMMPEVKAEACGEEDGVGFGSPSCDGRCLFLDRDIFFLDTTRDSEDDGLDNIGHHSVFLDVCTFMYFATVSLPGFLPCHYPSIRCEDWLGNS